MYVFWEVEMAIKSFKKLLNNVKKYDSYWVESAKLHYSVALNKHVQKKGISQTKLADKIGTSPAYITKIFQGDTNFTIETMVKLARAVDGELHIDIVAPKEKEEWAKLIAETKKIPHETPSAWIKSINSKADEQFSVTAQIGI